MSYYNTVNVRNPNMFGFQTGPHRPVLNLFEQLKRLKSEHICSNVRISDISTKLDLFIYKRGHKEKIYIYKMV